MAKNLGREFATMSEDERRKFALQPPDADQEEQPEELALDNPRNEDRMGRHYASPKDETADPDSRDGASALLDDEQHAERVREEGSKRRRK